MSRPNFAHEQFDDVADVLVAAQRAIALATDKLVELEAQALYLAKFVEIGAILKADAIDALTKAAQDNGVCVTQRAREDLEHVIAEGLAGRSSGVGWAPPPKKDWSAADKTSDVSVPWPVLDDAAYHGLIGEVVRAIEPHSEADPCGILIQSLAAFGNAVGIEPHYLVGGDKHRGKLFVVLCGSTSKGRKGTALSRVRQILAGGDAAWESNNIQGGLSSGEGLIFHVRDAVSKLGKDGAVEEIDAGVSDKRLMLVVEEFAGALGVMERTGNTLSPVLRDAWGTARLQTLTKNSPCKATDSHVSLIGHVTDHELRKTLTRTEMANGFANRILFVRVKRSKLLPHGGDLDAEVLRGLTWKVAVRLAEARRIGRVTMTHLASRAWEENYAVLSRDRPGLLGAILARAEPQVIRLALIYALTDGLTQIDLPHLAAAFAVWSYCEDSAAQIWGDMIGDDVADSILVALRAAGADGMGRTEISALFSRHQPAARISTALELLERLGKVERTEGGGHGERRWRLRRAS